MKGGVDLLIPLSPFTRDIMIKIRKKVKPEKPILEVI